MTGLVYLNKNLTKTEADALFCEDIERRKRLVDVMLNNAEKLNGKDASNYLSSCASLIAII